MYIQIRAKTQNHLAVFWICFEKFLPIFVPNYVKRDFTERILDENFL